MLFNGVRFNRFAVRLLLFSLYRRAITTALCVLTCGVLNGVSASVSDVCGHTEYALADLPVDFECSWIMVECVDKISVCRAQGCWAISQLNIGNRNRTHFVASPRHSNQAKRAKINIIHSAEQVG